MKPTIVEHQQGTDAWHQHRATHLNASDLAAAMGVSKYKSRAEFIKERATGIVPEIDDATQRRFDKGHEFEAIARQWAEEIIGDELYPIVLAADVDGFPLSASLDGQTMLGTVIWEHKTGSASLLESLERGVIPDAYHPQLEQQMMLSSAEKCLFMASNGTRETERHTWYESNRELRAKIVPTWAQFLVDLEAYEHTETVAAPVAAPIKDLPAIVITATGSLSVETNFDKWEIELRDFIKRIPEKPSTDQEFADCKAAVAAFKKAEAALDAEEARVLTMVPSVDDMRRQKKLLRDLSSTTRLALEKLVVKRDIDVKNEIVSAGKLKYEEHIKALNTRLGGQYMPYSAVDPRWAEAIKSKRSYATMRDAVDAALASAKAEASMTADRIELNRASLLIGTENDTSHLFPDFAAVCTKAHEDFAALHAMRIQQEAVRKEDARKAEEARIAAAVEAERKDGEARAAAAVEAERQAEAKRVAEAAQKATALTENNQTQFEAVSTKPTPEEKRSAVVEAQDVIADFIHSRNFGSTPAGTVRAILVEFVAYQAGQTLQAAA